MFERASASLDRAISHGCSFFSVQEIDQQVLDQQDLDQQVLDQQVLDQQVLDQQLFGQEEPASEFHSTPSQVRFPLFSCLNSSWLESFAS